MADNDFRNVETPINFEEKTICCFVIDVSGSMAGAPINELNKGLTEFHHEISQDSVAAHRLEIGIVTFHNEIEVVLNPTLVDNFTMPTLKTGGTTKLVDGVREAIKLVTDRKNWYKQTGQPYNRPWIVLITDGAPDAGQDINGLALEIESLTKAKKFMLLPIGVQGADMDVLNRISGYLKSKDAESWKQVPAMQLQGLKFFEFFQWLSESMGADGVTGAQEGEEVNFQDPTSWMKGLEI